MDATLCVNCGTVLRLNNDRHHSGNFDGHLPYFPMTSHVVWARCDECQTTARKQQFASAGTASELTEELRVDLGLA